MQSICVYCGSANQASPHYFESARLVGETLARRGLSLVYGAGQWIQSQISPNVSSIREYSSGDSLKHIHWGSTAHSGQLMVKLFDPDRSHSSAKTIWVVLDMQERVQCGEGLQSRGRRRSRRSPEAGAGLQEVPREAARDR